MKICVIGAGAIGGLLAAKLAHSGEEVSVVARGAHLAAIRARRPRPHRGGQRDRRARQGDGPHRRGRRAGSDHPRHEGASGRRRRALNCRRSWDRETLVLTAQNGIPWWYFFGHGGPHEGVRLESVDPGGVIADTSADRSRDRQRRLSGGRDRAAGRHSSHRGQPLFARRARRLEKRADRPRRRRPSPRPASRRRSSPTCAAKSGPSSGAISSFNPISALTHATLEDICRFAPTRALAADMMREAQAVGEAFGIRFRMSLEKRIAGAEAVGAHKTSMLQDVETGRAIEADALLGSVIELGAHGRRRDAAYRCHLRGRRNCSAKRWRRRQGPARRSTPRLRRRASFETEQLR